MAVLRGRGPWWTVTVGVLIIGAILSVTVRRQRLGFGVRSAPFFARYEPDIERLLALGALAALAVAIAIALRSLRARTTSRFLLGATVAALISRAGLNTARDGIEEWSAPIDPSTAEGRNEYASARSAVDAAGSVWHFLDTFAERVPDLPVHPSGHPPLPTIASWGLERVGLGSPLDEAIVLVLVGLLAVPLTYVLARSLLDEARGRVAALLMAFAPITLLESVTSFDGAFVTVSTGAAVLLVRPSLASRIAGGVATGVAGLVSYALPLVAVWVIATAVVRRRWRQAAGIAIVVGVGTLGLPLLLALTTGYDPIGALRATHHEYVSGIARKRPYAFWFFGGPLAFAIGLGPLLFAGVMRSLRERQDLAKALVLAILVAGIAGATKGEIERIWQFMVPIAAVAAAATWPVGSSRLRWALILASGQALVIEALFYTAW